VRYAAAAVLALLVAGLVVAGESLHDGLYTPRTADVPAITLRSDPAPAPRRSGEPSVGSGNDRPSRGSAGRPGRTRGGGLTPPSSPPGRGASGAMVEPLPPVPPPPPPAAGGGDRTDDDGNETDDDDDDRDEPDDDGGDD